MAIFARLRDATAAISKILGQTGVKVATAPVVLPYRFLGAMLTGEAGSDTFTRPNIIERLVGITEDWPRDVLARHGFSSQQTTSASVLNPSARDLTSNPAGHIQPDEVRTVVKYGVTSEKIVSAVSVEQAAGRSGLAAESKLTKSFFAKPLVWVGMAAGVAVAAAAYFSMRKSSQQDEAQAQETSGLIAAKPQAMTIQTPAQKGYVLREDARRQAASVASPTLGG